MRETPLYFHGTKADLAAGDLIVPGHASNFGSRRLAKYVYLSATLDAATWGAELAIGDAPGRIYLVEPLGDIEDDPNLTNTKFAGNPTLSYRSSSPFRVLGEVRGWLGHEPARLQHMRDRVAAWREGGIEATED